MVPTYNDMEDPAKSLVNLHRIALPFTHLFPWPGPVHLLLLLAKIPFAITDETHVLLSSFFTLLLIQVGFPVETPPYCPTLATLSFSTS